MLHPTWLANLVVVHKANGKWKLCIDFTDLNKACPKDPFPLSCIDPIVDSTSGCDLLSFLDAYSWYHQIFMSKEDEEKTSFITPCGMYCFVFMPFRLKSDGSTFARHSRLVSSHNCTKKSKLIWMILWSRPRIDRPSSRT